MDFFGSVLRRGGGRTGSEKYENFRRAQKIVRPPPQRTANKRDRVRAKVRAPLSSVGQSKEVKPTSLSPIFSPRTDPTCSARPCSPALCTRSKAVASYTTGLGFRKINYRRVKAATEHMRSRSIEKKRVEAHHGISYSEQSGKPATHSSFHPCCRLLWCSIFGLTL